jgi:hypothetical protein
MALKLDLTPLQELNMIASDLKNWRNLFPYEKTHIIRRLRELALQHDDVLGPDLTKSLLAAINILDITR